ncbi:tRNA-Thr(GGU) m(6)t(6)A37 methyltransferase TsaA [Actinoplanes campanulatus]|uniref:tRNA-Thr(GGU) m(6)t(6)A37 methyltransferase TsaA n=1 Tax=Actinoplanes campanulatus TaxID=113559 RepID=A0A7W5AFT4_9ACTN|nr:SAM-dependent methyltransferase [Actinoplanes campanulatus]MBB3095503.1 tRNA-Thr(GGU) m(6)t(6)A37 methyltransferase TsaA [Actinoplanes campanulatus]GGN09472.1 tRNA (N6-threonylcarbamoyladenosine(37)-N6)-methyltransferase TrmO [Actinoplanes campanulatus]GID36394.1 tRNA (N6-threonylcarbamoyladenosine(37)-N6)-methyltransferase TrmO [Actinoplanes campanulatus]
MTPIGIVRNERTTPEDDHWGKVDSVIELDATQVDADATLGLEEFSHIEVVFSFHLCDPARTTRGARHPRGNTALPKVGVLAQRVKDRPNHLGVSRCELIRVDGLRLHVRGLDAIDGTPVLDVKAFLSAMVPPVEAVREPAWVHDVMKSYYH